MKKLLTAALLLFLAVSFAHSQERMTVKPEGFDYTKIQKTPEVYIPVSTESRIVKTTAGNYLINPNVRIVPTSGNQTEISATIWTVNPNYVFVGTNSDPGQGILLYN